GESFSSVSDTSNETPPFKNFIPEFYPFLVGLDKNEKDLNIEFSGHFPNLKSKLDSVFVTISSEKGVSFIDKLKIRNDSSKAYSLYKNGGPFFITTSVKNRCGETSHRTKICNTVYLEVVLNKDNYPELSWTEYNYWPSGASRYIVQRRVQGIGFVEIDNVYGETSYVDKSILQTCLDKVEYRVVAVPFVENVGFYSLKATDKSYSNTSTLRSAPVVFIPNAFTPNGNGLNDSFRPSISYSKHTELDVFNKYGEKLTSKRGCHLGWNGEHNGSLCPNGTYTYILRATGTDDRTYTYSGTVTLIR
ncbi:MAG: gliding motility-associated C-terminal domain-containing protein, partial [Bacteroidia bacterium]